MFKEFDVEINEAEILQACREIKDGKAWGPDYFSNDFFKQVSFVLLPYLTKLVNNNIYIEAQSGFRTNMGTTFFLFAMCKKLSY